jgi:hypothetical protein
MILLTRGHQISTDNFCPINELKPFENETEIILLI